MRAALRLVSHDALSHVRERLNRQARCLSAAELTQLPPPAAAAAAAASSSAAQAQPGKAAGASAGGGGGGGAAGGAGPSGAPHALALVTDRVHDTLLQRPGGAAPGGGGAASSGAARRSGGGGGMALTLEALGMAPATALGALGVREGGEGRAAEGALDPRPALEAGMAELRGGGLGHMMGRGRLAAAAAGRAPDFQELLVVSLSSGAGAGGGGAGAGRKALVRAKVDVAAVLRGMGLGSTSGGPTGQGQPHHLAGKHEQRHHLAAGGEEQEDGRPGTPGRSDVIRRAGGVEASQPSFDVDDLLQWTADAARA